MAREVTSVRIEHRSTHFDRQQYHADARPFADVFITTADGAHYYTRLFHPLDDSPHARAAQAEAFKQRMAAADRHRAALA